MLHIIKQIKGSFIGLVESRFNNGEGFQVFDGAKDGKKDSKVDAQELNKIAQDVYKNIDSSDKKNELMKELNKRIIELGVKSYDNSENSQKYFDYLANKYSDIFKKITITKDNVSLNIKNNSKTERGTIKTKSDIIYDARANNSNIAEKTIRHSNKKGVESKIYNLDKVLDNNSKLLDYSKGIQDAFKEIAENNNEGYSLTRIFNELVGNNDKGKIILKELGKEEAFIKSNSAKLERALELLKLYKNIGATEENRGGIAGAEDPKFKLAKNFLCKAGAVLSVASKALPWATGVYLTDANIPWTSKIVPGLDLNKSRALQNWINDGMKKEFVYTEEDNDYGRNAVETAWDLRGTLTTYAGSNASEKFLSGKIEKLSNKEKELIKKALAVLIEPQMRYINNESFHGDPINWLMDTVFSDDAENADKALEDFSKILSSGGSLGDAINKAKYLVKQNEKEDAWGARQATKSMKNKVNYFDELSKDSKNLSKIAKLLNIGQNNLSILYKFENKQDFISAYGLQGFSPTINKVYTAIKKGDLNTLKKLKTFEKRLFSVVGTDKLGEFRLRYLQKIKGVKDAKRTGGKYGMDLRNAKNSSEVYGLLSKYGVEKNLNTVQTLFKGLVNTAKIDNVGFSEFDNALKNTENVSISEMRGKVLNTSKNGGGVLTTFESGLNKNDKNVRHTYIDKEFTYYQGGNKITEKVRYNIYLRPECSNLLVVPESISGTKKITKAPKLDNRMYNEIPLTTPVVIAYSIIKNITKTGTREKQVERTGTRQETTTETRHGTRTETRTGTREVPNPDVTSNPGGTGSANNASGGEAMNNGTTSTTNMNPSNPPVGGPDANVGPSNPGGDVPTIPPTVTETYTYTVEFPTTFSVDVVKNVTYTYFETVIEEFSYQVSKTIGRKLAESLFASIFSGLTQGAINKALQKCARDNNISEKDYKTFVEKDVPGLLDKAKDKGLIRYTSKDADISKGESVSKNTSEKIHIVEKGDTLSQIALDNGTNYIDLAKINGIKPDSILKIGQTIKFKK